MFSWSPLVLGYLGINLLAPGLNSASKVLHLEAGLLQGLRRFLAAATHLAVGHDLPALIQLTYAILQVAQWNEIPADLRDFVFMRFAHIEEEVVLARVALLLERSYRNLLDTVNQWRVSRRRRLYAAKLLVINQLGHGGMRAASRAIRILAQLELAEAHVQRVHQQQAPDERLALAQDQLDD